MQAAAEAAATSSVRAAAAAYVAERATPAMQTASRVASISIAMSIKEFVESELHGCSDEKTATKAFAEYVARFDADKKAAMGDAEIEPSAFTLKRTDSKYDVWGELLPVLILARKAGHNDATVKKLGADAYKRVMSYLSVAPQCLKNIAEACGMQFYTDAVRGKPYKLGDSAMLSELTGRVYGVAIDAEKMWADISAATAAAR